LACGDVANRYSLICLAMDLATIDIWETFAKFGLPGLALAVFYLLFRTFRWKFSTVPRNWVGPIVVLFMIITAIVVLLFPYLYRPKGQIMPGTIPDPDVALGTLPSKIYFATDHSNLDVTAKSLVKRTIGWMANQNPPVIEILLYGHTDSEGTEGYNNALGERLARAVKEEFVRQGVNSEHVRTLSHGEDDANPLFNKENPETARNYNCYVEIKFNKRQRGD
jgi:hypothetical protein